MKGSVEMLGLLKRKNMLLSVLIGVILTSVWMISWWFTGFILLDSIKKNIAIVPDTKFEEMIPEAVYNIITDKKYHQHYTSFDITEPPIVQSTNLARYNSQLAIAYGDILVDGIEYEYYIPLQKIPMSNKFVLKMNFNLIMKKTQLDHLIDPRFRAKQFPGILVTTIIFSRSDKTVTSQIEPDIPRIVSCLAVGFLSAYSNYIVNKSAACNKSRNIVSKPGT